MCASLRVAETLRRNESERSGGENLASAPRRRRIVDRPVLLLGRFEYERAWWDPKDGELCLKRVKPLETLVEARSDSDVQIDRRIWV